eukprot:g2376.t1
MLDDSMLKELLAKDLETLSSTKSSKSKSRYHPSIASNQTMRTYRHKSEMIGDVADAKKEYERAKVRLQKSEAELERLQREAKLASAKANVAKIKIKALLALMKKMISQSTKSDDGKSRASADGVGNLIEEKLQNIAGMIPQYNASLDEVTRLAKSALRSSADDNKEDSSNAVRSCEETSVPPSVGKASPRNRDLSDEGAWDSLIEKISMRD